MRSRSAYAIPAIAVLAFGCRLYPVLHGGGLKGLDGYDDGVYYSAADAVVSGRVPYRDFLLLHPPGLIYLLTPFAVLGRVVGDANGWATARIAMMLVGSASAVVVYLVLRRFGSRAAIVGATMYAVWPPTINGETSTNLECVPSLLLLLALLVLGSRRRSAARGYQLAAGAALGLGLAIKIWGLVPLLVVVAWVLVSHGWRRASMVSLGAAGAAVVVCASTFVLAPGRMWELVVADQFTRSGANTSLLSRLEAITPVQRIWPSATTTEGLALVIAVGLVAAAAVGLAVRVPGARVFVALLIAQCIVLCASPPFFSHYTAFTGPAAALTGGVGAQQLLDLVARHVPRLRRPVLATLVIAAGVTATPSFTRTVTTPFDASRVAHLLAGRHCVVTDSPGTLVLADVLTRDLDRRCPTRIDVSGATYNVDAVVGPNGRLRPRIQNPLWQKDIVTYLLSGQAAIVARSAPDGFDRSSRHRLAARPLLYRAHGVSVYGS